MRYVIYLGGILCLLGGMLVMGGCGESTAESTRKWSYTEHSVNGGWNIFVTIQNIETGTCLGYYEVGGLVRLEKQDCQ